MLLPLLVQLASDGRLAVQVQRAEPVPGDAVLLVAAELLLVAVWVAVDLGDFALLRILEQVWVVPALRKEIVCHVMSFTHFQLSQ